MDVPQQAYTAFQAHRRIARGSLVDVALATKTLADEDPRTSLLVFEDATGRVVDLDLRGTPDHVRERIQATEATTGEPAAEERSARRGPGRPRLGVVSKEVTLLPRHWAWLAAQRGGASATLRRLVEEARRATAGRDEVRRAQDAAFRFMSAMGGDLPGYEEAIRALFAADRARFEAEIGGWPADVGEHARLLAAGAFATPSGDPT